MSGMPHQDARPEALRSTSMAERVSGFVDRLGSVLDLRGAGDIGTRTRN